MPKPGEDDEEDDDLATRVSGPGSPSAPEPSEDRRSAEMSGSRPGRGEDEETIASVAGGASSTPGPRSEVPTSEIPPDLGLDLVSLPPRPKARPAPPSPSPSSPSASASARPAAGRSISSLPGLTRPPTRPSSSGPQGSVADDAADEPITSELGGPSSRAPAADDSDEGETIASVSPSTEMPTGEIPPGRDIATQAGGFASSAGSAVPSRAPDEASIDDEVATIADAGLTERQRALLGQEKSQSPSVAGTHAPTVADPAAGTGQTQRTGGPVPASKYSRGTARDPIAGSGALRATVPGARIVPTQLSEGMLLADRYELVKRLGKGGMGEVWQAKHTLLQGMRAIKVIKASISRDPTFRARFLSEGQTMMRVKHPGVVEVTDLDETRQNRELFMVMEYLQGRTMHAAVRDEKEPLSADPRDAARIHMDLALGMQRIHDERIVHKDLKTDNVVLVKGDDGLVHPKVIDFGLAKRLEDKNEVKVDPSAPDTYGTADPDLHTTLSGTLAYMAPEQFLGEPSSFQSDIYAFGVMLYECFTRGEYPMPRGSLGDYVKRHKDKVVPKRLRQARPDLDPFLADLADRCMAPSREQRPASFTDVAEEIDWWLKAPERAQRRKNWIYLGSAATFLVAVAVWGFFFQPKASSIQGLTLSRAGGTEPFKERGRDRYIGDADLGAIAVDGVVNGEKGEPSFLVDGAAHAADLEIVERDGRTRLTGTIDLTGIADGRHEIGFRAMSGADPTTVGIVVDRRPPVIQSVEFDSGPGRFTASPVPAVAIRTDDPPALLASVDVRNVRTGKTVPANVDGDGGTVWHAQVAVDADGESTIEVRATDIAGNVAKPVTFTFHRDTVAPALDVETDDGLVADAGPQRNKLQVRTPSGNRVRVHCGEDATLRAAFQRAGAGVAESRDFPASKSFDVAVPEIPPEGLTLTLAATDRAGNETKRTIAVSQVADVVRVETADGKSRLVVTQADAVPLAIRRPYALRKDLSVTFAQLLDADGAPPENPRHGDLAGCDVTIDPVKPTDAQLVLPRELPAGAYGVSISGLAGATSPGIEVVVDPDRPVIGAVVVRDAEGREVLPGKWSLTAAVTVTVEVTDLSLEVLTLSSSPTDAVAPSEFPAPGRRTYTFRTTLASEGATQFTLFAQDAAKNTEKVPVEIRADWTVPVVTLRTPASGVEVNDVDPVVFEGSCSEDAYDLVITGVRGGSGTTSHTARAFSDQWLVDRGDGAVAGAAVDRDVSVVAIDRAGRASAAVQLRLRVQHVSKELPVDWTWAGPLAARMRQIRPGDVVIDGRTQPVTHCFLDLTEVTNRQYRTFLEACVPHAGKKTPWDHPDQPATWSHVPFAETWGDPKWNADDLPVVNVAWWDAWAFAKWSGRRLPTESEWVKAAAKGTGAGELELRSWPPIAAGEPWRDGLLATAEATQQKGPVDATKTDDVSPSGCLHMGGNVSEWVDLPFARDGDPRTGVRGGSWWTSRFGADVRRVPSKPYDRSFRAKTIGFRCAVDATQVQP